MRAPLDRRRREVEAIFEKYGLLHEERDYVWRAIVALSGYEFGVNKGGAGAADVTRERGAQS